MEASPIKYVYDSTYITFAVLTKSPCFTGSYVKSSPPATQSYSLLVGGSQTQTSVVITNFFSIPDTSCYFYRSSLSDCWFVETIGTSTTQGTTGTCSFISLNYYGSGSTATV
jgi:hypothetical protein